MIKFIAWPKLARLRRPFVITEKIDGTGAAVGIVRLGAFVKENDHYNADHTVVLHEHEDYLVYAQSRNRVITRHQDNHGFANWVHENASGLVTTLGEGLHFGEWWGSGIQRGYGLQKGEKRLSLFNTSRWGDVDLSAVEGLGVVPVLCKADVFDTHVIEQVMAGLEITGSHAAPGFMRPEGVVVYHVAANTMFKVTFEHDEMPKSAVGRNR